MNDMEIVTTYVVIDDILKAYGFVDDCRAMGTAGEILTVGVVAAKYFQNHHERALCLDGLRLRASTECVALQPALARAASVVVWDYQLGVGTLRTGRDVYH